MCFMKEQSNPISDPPALVLPLHITNIQSAAGMEARAGSSGETKSQKAGSYRSEELTASQALDTILSAGCCCSREKRGCIFDVGFLLMHSLCPELGPGPGKQKRHPSSSWAWGVLLSLKDKHANVPSPPSTPEAILALRRPSSWLT